jgi:pimeloyl-ACP methyl ester carboxylesterase
VRIGHDVTKAVPRLALAGAGAAGLAVVANRTRAIRARTDTAATRRYRDCGLNPPARTPEIRRVVTSDGAILNVAIYGRPDGQPIVFSHGWCEAIAYWNPQINELAQQYRVIAFDHRGHGASSRGARRETADVLADDLADVLAATLRPGERAVLVGHSMGGMTIMSWAHRHRAQAGFAGAILLHNTGHNRMVEETRLFPLLPAGLLSPAAGMFLLSGTLPFPPSALIRTFIKWRIMPGGSREQVDFCARMFSACDPRARGSWGRALARLDLDGPAPIAGVPTTVIAGERDYLTPPVHARRIAAALERAGTLEELVVIPGIGHQGNIEAAERFNAEVVRLAEIVRGTSAMPRTEAAG